MKTLELLKTRENIYAFLARMYLEEPPKKLAEDIANKRLPLPEELLPLNTDLREGFSLIKKFEGDFKGSADELYENLQEEYTRLFIGPSEDAILPYESSYMEKNFTGKVVIKAKENYRKAGIEKVEECNEPEDHVALELDFMAYLCKGMTEKLRGEEKIKRELVIQREFLDGCLAKWVPQFCEDIIKSPNSDFYKGIAKITKGFLVFDSSMMDEIAALA
jgi:anaerobic sulfite reductase subunit A